MQRNTHAKYSERALERITGYHSAVVGEVQEAVATNKVVVVGMAQNPHVKRVRKVLKSAGIEFQYLEYGSYLSMWRPRLAIKLWSGWPTYPQIFVGGELVGGASDVEAGLEDGSLRKSLG